ncbi:uncharacterized protein LOC129286430 [Prosopis cineraria]|uniref:uncharacterized protein LOC129286430 n=1 Tax=Prosopis cineraria TaxID=364024 RepID=UPI00240EAAA4|nr:uncharacterized protein LOC129286430 [Prosopis cineraria]
MIGSARLNVQYTISREEAQTALNLITGTVSICEQRVEALFDSGATHSFVSHDCVKELELPVYELPYIIKVSTPSILLDKTNEMVLLLVHVMPIGTSTTTVSQPTLLSVVQPERLVSEGCQAYAAFFAVGGSGSSSVDEIQVVNEFPKVFANKVSVLPPEQKVEFSINLAPGIKPISKAPYRMARLKLVELKKKFKELLEKGFLCRSMSPWGSPILFVKKKDGSLRLCIDYRTYESDGERLKFSLLFTVDLLLCSSPSNSLFANVFVRYSYLHLRRQLL